MYQRLNFWVICVPVWGLYVHYSSSAVEHKCAIWLPYFFSVIHVRYVYNGTCHMIVVTICCTYMCIHFHIRSSDIWYILHICPSWWSYLWRIYCSWLCFSMCAQKSWIYKPIQHSRLVAFIMHTCSVINAKYVYGFNRLKFAIWKTPRGNTKLENPYLMGFTMREGYDKKRKSLARDEKMHDFQGINQLSVKISYFFENEMNYLYYSQVT